MARRKVHPVTQPVPNGPRESDATPGEPAASPAAEAQAAEPVRTTRDAQPTPTRESVEADSERGGPKPRTTLTYVVPDGTVSMIDDGNRGGLGVRFALGGRRPSPAVLEAVKEDRTYGQAVKRGLAWTHGQWRKRVGENPVGDRLEVEGRVKDAAERILAERENPDAGRDPF